MFEKASRMKLRFKTARGNIGVEDLWDIPLVSNNDFNLDEIAKAIYKTIKSDNEESFVKPKKSLARDLNELRLEIIKHIIATRLAEEAKAKKRADNRAELEKLKAIAAEKSDAALRELSQEDLMKRIKELENDTD